MKQRILYVPSNVSLRGEIWQGLSIKDAVYSLLITLAAAATSAVLVNVCGFPLFGCVLGVLIVGAVCIGLFSKLPDINRSMLDQIGIILNYQKSQKQYQYLYNRNVVDE